MKILGKPGLFLGIFIGIYLVVGVLIVKDYGFSPDEPIEKKRASIALSNYGIDLGYLGYDYDDLGHSQFYGTATSMVLIWADTLFSPILNIPAGVIMHYGYFLTFVLAIITLFYLIKIFVNPWIALFTSILFATQPLLFGHAFMNPKDIPLLAVFLLTVTIGFYIDRHKLWKQSMDAEIALPNLFHEWKKVLVSLPRATFRTLLLLPAALALILILKPILTSLLTQFITTAYTDHQSIWGIVLTRVATNLSSTPLQDYVNKGVTNLVRFLNVTSSLFFLGFLAYGMTIFRKGFRQLPQDLQDRSILHSLSIHLKNPLLIMAALSYGFAISTRIVTIFAGGIVILYLLWIYRRKAILPVVIYAFFSTLSAYLSWPVFWRYGIYTVFKALSLFSNFDPYIGSILFMGEIIRAYEIPWNYLPQLLLVQFTEPVIILCSLGFIGWIIFLFLDRKWSNQNTKLLLVFLWFTLPFTYVVATTPIMYNNFRQFIFITPPLFIFAALAIQFLQDRLDHRVIFPFVLSLTFVPGILNLFSLHPYQYIYFNQFAGGVRGAFRNYDLDYWNISMKEAMEYVNATAPENAHILVWDVEYTQAILYNRPDISINRIAHITEAEYPSYQLAVIPLLRNVDKRIPEDWNPVHTVSRSGADLVVIYNINGE
ncbi:MAG TPA: hypothetical protein VI451_12695 [Anaerolineales bacterium]|nr:hypothetical protein [Anaerolineales bacterium]